jgi:hypothetical protein
MRWSLLAVVLCTAQIAAAQEQPARRQETPPAPQQAAPSPTQSDEALKKELEKALQQDAAKKPGAAAPPAAVPQEQPSPQQPSTPQAAPTAGRGTQSLNPDISAILDGNAGYERRGVSYRNGDDPDLRGRPGSPGAGFTAQEVELAASAIVDPYFRGDVFLTIPNLSGLEVEEAFATTTSLPGNLQVKAGSFRSAFGRQNGQHLHVQDFTRRPLLNAAFLGADGLRGPGAQVSWLTPAPFYLVVSGEAFSIAAPDVPASGEAGPVSSFGGGTATDLTYAVEAKVFVPAGESLSIYGGVSGATGVSAGFSGTQPPGFTFVPGAGRRSVVAGADLYVKWKPPNETGGYTSLAWQTEAIFRHLGDGAGIGAEWDGGAYTQLVLQFARNWFAGIRGDYVGLPQSTVVGRTLRGAVDLTWQASEFARVRGYLETEHAEGTGAFQPAVTTGASPQASFAAYLQLEFSIGAHGAHPF